jgi:hypothetical protein
MSNIDLLVTLSPVASEGSNGHSSARVRISAVGGCDTVGLEQGDKVPHGWDKVPLSWASCIWVATKGGVMTPLGKGPDEDEIIRAGVALVVATVLGFGSGSRLAETTCEECPPREESTCGGPPTRLAPDTQWLPPVRTGLEEGTGDAGTNCTSCGAPTRGTIMGTGPGIVLAETIEGADTLRHWARGDWGLMGDWIIPTPALTDCGIATT